MKVKDLKSTLSGGTKQYAWEKDILLRQEGIDKLDAQAVGQELEIIESELGTLTPQVIVNWAELNEDSELHKCFTWDTEEEAMKWRIQKARNIAGRIRLVFMIEDDKGEQQAQKTYAWVNVRDSNNQRSYVSVQAISADADLTKATVKEAMLRLFQWYDRNNHLRESLNIIDTIEDELKGAGYIK